MAFPVVTLESIPSHGLSVEVRDWALPGCGEGLGGSARSVHGQLEVTRVGPDIRVTGQVTGSATVTCDRCGEPHELSASADVSCLYLAPRALDEGEPETEEEELGEYDGVALDLVHVVRESLALERPVRVLCADFDPAADAACLSRYRARAGTSTPEPDPRLAALKGFKPTR